MKILEAISNIKYLKEKVSQYEIENRKLREENEYLKKKINDAISMLDENMERSFMENYR